jgi:hypothetical protein
LCIDCPTIWPPVLKLFKIEPTRRSVPTGSFAVLECENAAAIDNAVTPDHMRHISGSRMHVGWIFGYPVITERSLFEIYRPKRGFNPRFRTNIMANDQKTMPIAWLYFEDRDVF